MDYRGEVGIILENTSNTPVVIYHGDAIAQLVLKEAPQIEWEKVNSLPTTVRGTGGFGHTDNKNQ